VLLIAGGTVAGVLLVRQAHSHPIASTPASIPASDSTTGTSAPPSPAATAPPTQLDIQGLTVGIGAVNTDPNVTNVASVIGDYFAGIDARNYLQAWNLYTQAQQAAVPFQPWSSELSTTHDSQIAVQTIQQDPAAGLDATVLFQSHQAPQYGPNQGETCTNWSLVYQLVPSGGQPASPATTPSYLIGKVTNVGAGHSPC
jgi:hypothetical protein